MLWERRCPSAVGQGFYNTADGQRRSHSITLHNNSNLDVVLRQLLRWLWQQHFEATGEQPSFDI
eukprot:1053730-Prorocentrum_lima.AAC.1